jgi:hypothetical protein
MEERNKLAFDILAFTANNNGDLYHVPVYTDIDLKRFNEMPTITPFIQKAACSPFYLTIPIRI